MAEEEYDKAGKSEAPKGKKKKMKLLQLQSLIPEK